MNEIQSKFKVSISLLSKIKRLSLSLQCKSIYKEINDEMTVFLNFIKKYSQPKLHALNVKRITKYLIRSLKSSFPNNFARNSMKLQMKLCYTLDSFYIKEL